MPGRPEGYHHVPKRLAHLFPGSRTASQFHLAALLTLPQPKYTYLMVSGFRDPCLWPYHSLMLSLKGM